MDRKFLHKLLALFCALFTGAISVAQAQDPVITTVIDQNFDVFTEGSESQPSETNIGGYTGKFTKTLTGWNAKDVFEAGGCIKIGGNGNIRTPYSDLSTDGGHIKITFRAKSLADYGCIMMVKMGYSASEMVFLPDGEWHDVSVLIDGGKTNSYIQIEPNLTLNGVLFDDLKIQTSMSFIKAPVALQPTIATKTSFYATWEKVKDADNYLLDVYKYNSDEEKDYLMKDSLIAGTKTMINVEGLDENSTYFFTVRAKRGEYVSDYSNEIEVVPVYKTFPAPVATEATNVTASSFTANWVPVEDAYAYSLEVYASEVLANDTVVNVLEEDFNKVDLGDIFSVEYGDMEEYLDKYTSTPGWYAYMDCYAKGYIGLYPFSSPAILATPEVDLSSNEGKFSAIVNMASYNYSGAVAGDTVVFKLYNGENIDEKQMITLKGDFQDYTIDFTKGTANSVLVIEYLNGGNKLFIDNYIVNQARKKGETVTNMIANEYVEAPTTKCDITLTPKPNTTYSYIVKAWVKTVINGEIGYLSSQASNKIIVDLPSSVETLSNDAVATVKAYKNNIYVTLSQSAPIEVYNLSGQVVAKVNGIQGQNVIPCQNGVALVRVNGQTKKIVVK